MNIFKSKNRQTNVQDETSFEQSGETTIDNDSTIQTTEPVETTLTQTSETPNDIKECVVENYDFGPNHSFFRPLLKDIEKCFQVCSLVRGNYSNRVFS